MEKGKFKLYLRKSDSSNPLGNSSGHEELQKTPYRVLTKDNVFDNLIRTFGNGDNINIIADNVTDRTLEFMRSYGIKNIFQTKLGQKGAFLYALNKALSDIESDDDIIYIVEDDYLHIPKAEQYLREGLSVADYVTLYDCLDKYKDSDKGGYNPFIYNGGEDTKVIITESIHWKYTNATTNTYAVKAKTLKDDADIIKHYASDMYPWVMDFSIFRYLITEKNRILINSIPGGSAHIGLEMPPFVDWLSFVNTEM